MLPEASVRSSPPYFTHTILEVYVVIYLSRDQKNVAA
jgi:hypothetical protein